MEKGVKAYLAGIVDGEGTVTLSRNHRNELPCPVVSVSNTSLPLLKWIQKKAGGIITSKNTSKPHHAVSYVWRLRHDKAIWILNEVKEYLIVKRKHADLIIQEYKKNSSSRKIYSAATPEKK